MSTDHLYFEWWVEGDDIWIRHDCNGDIDTWKAPPPWRLDGKGGVTPSFDCKRCGKHAILRDADRVERLDYSIADRRAGGGS